MSLHPQTQRNAGLSWAASGLICCLLTSLILVSRWTGDSRPSLELPSPASVRATTAPRDETEPRKALILVDATQEDSADLEALRVLVQGLALPSSPSLDRAATATQGVDWFLWSRLAAGHAGLKVTGASAEEIGAYAAQSPEGAALLLVNRLNVRAECVIKTRLERGVYKIDRLLFSRAEGQERMTSALRRLEGADLEATAQVSKTLALEPGEALIVRYSDEARAARAARYDTFAKLDALSRQSETVARRLRNMLKEGEPYVSGLLDRPGVKDNLSRRMGCVQRLRLINSQAQSFLRNYMERKTVKGATAEELMAALELYTDALEETGAVLIGLVPQMQTLWSAPETANAPRGLRTATDADRSVSVVFQVQNTGSQNVEMVKIGLDSASLPQSVTADPPDPVYVGTLRPGQIVKKTFRLRGAVTDSSALSYAGDVAYQSARLIGHLRVRSW